MARAFTLLESLVASETLAHFSTECSRCGQNNDAITDYCQNCGNELDLLHRLSVLVPAVNTPESIASLRERDFRSRDLAAFCDSWERAGVIFYVMLDTVGSQPLQEAVGDLQYKELLDEVRKRIRMRVLSQLRNRYLTFGEIGDMHKIGFTDPKDVMRFFEKFSGALSRGASGAKLSFPPYSAKVVAIPMPTDKDGANVPPRSVLTSTLNGAIDFSSKVLTRSYRFEASIKTRNDVYSNDRNLSVWVFRDAQPCLPSVGTPVWSPVHYEKIPFSADGEATLLFFGNGRFLGFDPDPGTARIKMP